MYNTSLTHFKQRHSLIHTFSLFLVHICLPISHTFSATQRENLLTLLYIWAIDKPEAAEEAQLSVTIHVSGREGAGLLDDVQTQAGDDDCSDEGAPDERLQRREHFEHTLGVGVRALGQNAQPVLHEGLGEVYYTFSRGCNRNRTNSNIGFLNSINSRMKNKTNNSIMLKWSRYITGH